MNGLSNLLDLTKRKLVRSMANAAVAGLVMDGAFSAVEKKEPKSIVRDMGCGAVTGAVSAATITLFREYVKRTGPLSLVVGASASVATRYAYRGVFGPKLTKEEEEDGREAVRHES